MVPPAAAAWITRGVLLMCVLVGSVKAANQTVLCCNFTAIAMAVANAQPGSFVFIGPGVYTGAGLAPPILLPTAFTGTTERLTVMARDGPGTVTIMGPASGNAYRVIDLRPPAVVAGYLVTPYNTTQIVQGVACQAPIHCALTQLGIGDWITFQGIVFKNHQYTDQIATNDRQFVDAQYFDPYGNVGTPPVGALVAFTSRRTRFVDCVFEANNITLPPLQAFEGGVMSLLKGALIQTPVSAQIELIGCNFTKNIGYVDNLNRNNFYREDIPTEAIHNVQPYYGGILIAATFDTAKVINCAFDSNNAMSLLMFSVCPHTPDFRERDLYWDGSSSLTSSFESTHRFEFNSVDLTPCSSRFGSSRVTVSGCSFSSTIGTPILADGVTIAVINSTFTDATLWVPYRSLPPTLWTIGPVQAAAITFLSRKIHSGRGLMQFSFLPNTGTVQYCDFRNNVAAHTIEVHEGPNVVNLLDSMFYNERMSSDNETVPASLVECHGQFVQAQGVPAVAIFATLVATRVTMNGNYLSGAEAALFDTDYCSAQITASNLANNDVDGLGGLVFCDNPGSALAMSSTNVTGTTGSLNFDGTNAHCASTHTANCGCCSPTILEAWANNQAITLIECPAFKNYPCAYTCNDPTLVPKFKTIKCLDAITPQPSQSTTLCTLPSCPKPVAPLNGNVDKYSPVLPGGIVTYTCSPGFTINLHGDPAGDTATCLGPNYDKNPPTCDQIPCDPITAPEHASLTTFGAGYQSFSTIVCATGYQINGSATIYCDAQGHWPPTPTCEAVVCRAVGNYSGTCVTQDTHALDPTESCSLACLAGHIGAVYGAVHCIQPTVNGPGAYDQDLPNCVACPANDFAPEAQTACTPCPNGITLYTGAETQAECLCLAGYYESEPNSGQCESCPEGGVCAGGRQQPTTAAGYILSKGVYVKCAPVEACHGNDTCSPGYTGLLCGLCDEGYYQLSGRCVSCPSSHTWQLYVGVIIGAVLTISSVFLAQPGDLSLNINLATPAIAINLAQAMSFFIDIDFPWGDQLISFFRAMTFFNVNFDLLNVECVTKFTYYDKLTTQLVAPLVVFVWFILVGAGLCIAKCVKLRGREGLANAAQKIVLRFAAGYLLFLSVVYMYLARASVSFFSCFKQADGTVTLTVAPGQECYSAEWEKHLPIAIYGLVVYVLGIPVALAVAFYLVQRWYGHHATVTHPLTSFYVNKYREPTWYWETLIMLRKLLIVFFTLYFVGSVTAQAVANSVVLLVACLVTLYAQPFLWNKHDFVESAALVSCLCVLVGGIIMNANGVSDAERGNVSAILIAIITVIAVLVTSFTGIELYVRVKTLIRVRTTQSSLKATQAYKKGKGMIDAIVQGDYVVSACASGEFTIWRKGETEPEHVIEASEGRPVAACAVRDGVVAVASESGELKLISIESGEVIASGSVDAKLRCLACRDGILVAGDAAGSVHVITSLPSGSGSGEQELEVERSWEAHPDEEITAICISKEYVYTAAGKLMAEWNLKTKKNTAEWTVHREAVTCMRLEGRILVSGNFANEAVALDITTGEVVQRFPGHPDAVSAVALTTDGHLFTGCGDASIRMWNLKSGVVEQLHKGHGGRVTALQVDSIIPPSMKSSANADDEKDAHTAGEEDGGVRLVSASLDGTVRHWEINFAQNVVRKSDEVRDTTNAIFSCLCRPCRACCRCCAGKKRTTAAPEEMAFIPRRRSGSNSSRTSRSDSESGADDGNAGLLDARLGLDVSRDVLQNLTTEQKRAILAAKL